MPMTIVVTRNAPDRVRGFLASCMLEIAPGVYTSPRMTKSVRTRVFNVLSDWYGEYNFGLLMTWPDRREAGGQGIWILGAPKTELYEHDGLHLVKHSLSKKLIQLLEK